MSFERSWHRSYPAAVPTEIAFDRITMPEVLTRTARRFPRRAALNYMGRFISYEKLDAMVNAFARALTGMGVKKGDTVAMLLPNIPQVVIANYAAWRIGAVAAQNNPLYTERELTYQLNDSDATVLVTLDLLLPRALKIRADTKVRHIVTCHISDYLPFPKKQLFPFVKKQMYKKVERQDGVSEFLDLMEGRDSSALPNEAGWDDVGTLIYTGGTTGVSKGVMLTHANMSCNVQQLRSWFYDIEDGNASILAIFPFFHSAGFTGMQNFSVWGGWTDVLVPRPEPSVIIELLRKYRPDFMPGVPTIFIGLLNTPEFRSMDLRFIKGFIAGAAPLSVETINDLKNLTGGDLINVYGLTETSPMGTASPWRGNIKPGTVGVPFPSTDLKIVDVETGTREMKQGASGEICFRGPQVMKGYYKKPEETANVLKDGWLFTGDIGFLDEDGYLTIVDRKKDMIVAAGYNIFPQEIDEILFTHPKVLEACTIGIPDAYRGEAPKAYVVPKPGETIDRDELIRFLKERLAAYKVPKDIEIMNELPKSAVGKILRKELRDLERKKREGAA
ncbi:MAG TPA: long-chain fatty acid--CoA ligase [Deltaproteobacteria bacterium]|nr:long-chain fatty acid--CoA ligase [Deltaproteobacteria bacterium]